MPDRSGFVASMLLDTDVSTTVSVAVQIPQWARYGALYLPTITSSAITFDIMEDVNATASKLVADQTTDWITLRDEAESSQVIGAGTAGFWIDITEFVKAIPANCWLRVKCGTAQASDRIFRLSLRGA